MSDSKLNRREFLLGASFCGTALLLEFSACKKPKSTYRVSIPISELLKQETPPPAVGNRFLEDHPEEKGVSSLLQKLFPALSETSSTQELAEAFRVQVRKEFEAGELFSVDGWLLAKSEARLCALAALVGN